MRNKNMKSSSKKNRHLQKKSLFYRKQNIYAWKSDQLYQIWKVMIILQYILREEQGKKNARNQQLITRRNEVFFVFRL